MPKSSRRKQSKPQHLLSEEEDGGTDKQDVTSSQPENNTLDNQSTQEGQDGSGVKGHCSLAKGWVLESSGKQGVDISDKDLSSEETPDTSASRRNGTSLSSESTSATKGVSKSDSLPTGQAAVLRAVGEVGEEEDVEEDESDSKPLWYSPQPPVMDRYCVYCKVTLDSAAELQTHLRKHHEDSPFLCQICFKSFKSKRHLQYHKVAHHGIQQAEFDSNVPQNLSQDRKRSLDMMQPQPPSSMPEMSSLHKEFSNHLTSPTQAEAQQPISRQDDPHLHTGPTPYHLSSSSPIDLASKRQRLVSFNTQLPYSRAIPPLMSDVAMAPTFDPTVRAAPHEALAAMEASQDMMRACQVCAKMFPKPSDLKRHMMCHTGEKPFKCEFCGKPFRAKSSMHYHLKAAHGLDIELSPGLEERYLRMKTRAHMNMLQRSQLLGLPQAPISETSSADLPLYRDHGDLDEVEEDSRSTDSSFLQNSGYGNEAKPQGQNTSTSKTSQHDSSISDKSEQSVSNRSEHSTVDAMDTMPGFESRGIGQVIASEEPFKRSQIQIQNETVLVTRLDGLNLVSGEAASIYKCYLCGKMFNKLSNIQCHLSLHFDKQVVSFECCFCDEIFPFKTQMRNHIRKKHSTHLRRKFKMGSATKCSDAKKDTSSSSESLNAKLVQTVGPGLKIAQNKKVKKLHPSHRGKRFSVCRYCRKLFTQPLALQKHMRMHFWNRNCFCRICGKSFNQYTSLQLHISRCHWKLGMSHKSPKKSNFFHSFRYQGHVHADSLRKLQLPEVKVKEEGEDLSMAGKRRQLSALTPDSKPTGAVIPSQDNGEASDPATSHNSSENDWSESQSENGTETEEKTMTGIRTAPKRSLMPFRKENGHGKSLRKPASSNWSGPSKSPVQVKSEPMDQDNNNNEPLPLVTNHDSPDDRGSCSPDPQLAAYNMNATNHLLYAKALAAQTMASHLGKAISPPTIFPTTTSSSNLPPSSYPLMPMPISVQVPNENSRNSKSPSPGSMSSSKSDQSPPEERPGLVGYPRVQWSPNKMAADNSWRFSMYYPETSLTTDGRKVTSLSRTHSRLPIVHMPVNRESICKPTSLPDGRTVYRCPFCSKDFVSFSDINRHMDFHEGKSQDIRPYKCQYCDYFARTNSQLKVHMMRHQGIREYCCKLCNYKGVTQSDLNRHMKSQIHMLKSRNACSHCGEGFVTTKNLEKHLDGNCIVKVQKLQNGGLDMGMEAVM